MKCTVLFCVFKLGPITVHSCELPMEQDKKTNVSYWVAGILLPPLRFLPFQLKLPPTDDTSKGARNPPANLMLRANSMSARPNSLGDPSIKLIILDIKLSFLFTVCNQAQGPIHFKLGRDTDSYPWILTPESCTRVWTPLFVEFRPTPLCKRWVRDAWCSYGI